MQPHSLPYIDLTGDDSDDDAAKRLVALYASGGTQETAIEISDASDRDTKTRGDAEAEVAEPGGGDGGGLSDASSNAPRARVSDHTDEGIDNDSTQTLNTPLRDVEPPRETRERLGNALLLNSPPAANITSIIGQNVPAAASTPVPSLGPEQPPQHASVNIVDAAAAGASVLPTPVIAAASKHDEIDANTRLKDANSQPTNCSDAAADLTLSHDKDLPVEVHLQSVSHFPSHGAPVLEHQRDSIIAALGSVGTDNDIAGSPDDGAQREEYLVHGSSSLLAESIDRTLTTSVMNCSKPTQPFSQTTVALSCANLPEIDPRSGVPARGEPGPLHAKQLDQSPSDDSTSIESATLHSDETSIREQAVVSPVSARTPAQSVEEPKIEDRTSTSNTIRKSSIVKLYMQKYLQDPRSASKSSIEVNGHFATRKRLRSLSPQTGHRGSDRRACKGAFRSRASEISLGDADVDIASSVRRTHSKADIEQIRQLNQTLARVGRPRKTTRKIMLGERGPTSASNGPAEPHALSPNVGAQSRNASESAQLRPQRRDFSQTVVRDKPSGKFLVTSSHTEQIPPERQPRQMHSHERREDAEQAALPRARSIPMVSIEPGDDEMGAGQNRRDAFPENIKRGSQRTDRFPGVAANRSGLKNPRLAIRARDSECGSTSRPDISYSATPGIQKRGNDDHESAAAPAWSGDDVTLDARIRSTIQTRLQECREDTEYWHQMWLRTSRHKAVHQTQKQMGKPTSIFARLKPITVTPGKRQGGDRLVAEFQVELLNMKPSKANTWSVAYSTLTSTHPSTSEPPDYSHYVSIKNNFLAHNETVLQRWPYFGEDFNDAYDAPGLAEHYFFDTMQRPRKLDCMLQAERFAPYAQDMLSDSGCSWVHVLRFLLETCPNVGSDLHAMRALAARESFCDEDFARGSRRWSAVLLMLPAASAELVGRAAILCEIFQKCTNQRLWHVVRRSDYVASLLGATTAVTAEALTCRICMRHNCPYHGEIHESLAGSDIRVQEAADDEAVETDIIVPREVNFRQRVEFPASSDSGEVTSPFPERHSLKWWLESGMIWRPEERPPYYPCSHPGESCSNAQCICFRNNVPCEKMCSCGSTCSRKWQGCSCSTKTKKNQKHVCFEDDRCACYGLNRECDPDLCGNCGVCEVLDPLHRSHDAILSRRCNNANIQRGVVKRTLLGTSMVHGFGLYAGQKIVEHDFVGEYKGEIITKSESDRRAAVYEHQKLSYLFSLNKTQEIDSTYFGNKVRFINHANSKTANLYPRIMLVNLVHRIGLFGSRHTKNGEELFFDYGPEFPDEQLGGAKATKKDTTLKAAKSAPRVRNSRLTREFFDVDYRQDALGNRRAVKAGFGGSWDQSQNTAHSSDVEMLPQRQRAYSKQQRRRQRHRIIDDDEDDEIGDSHEESEGVREAAHGSSARHRHRDDQTVFEGSYVNDGLQAMDIDDGSVDGDFEPDDDDDSGSGDRTSEADDDDEHAGGDSDDD